MTVKQSNFRATIEVVESMGSDVSVYFTPQSDLSAKIQQLADLIADSGRDVGWKDETVTARLSTETRIREGDNAELSADTRALHVFDPQSGANLWLPPARSQPAVRGHRRSAG